LIEEPGVICYLVLALLTPALLGGALGFGPQNAEEPPAPLGLVEGEERLRDQAAFRGSGGPAGLAPLLLTRAVDDRVVRKRNSVDGNLPSSGGVVVGRAKPQRSTARIRASPLYDGVAVGVWGLLRL
jgi:hypothetical protein